MNTFDIECSLSRSLVQTLTDTEGSQQNCNRNVNINEVTGKEIKSGTVYGLLHFHQLENKKGCNLWLLIGQWEVLCNLKSNFFFFFF